MVTVAVSLPPMVMDDSDDYIVDDIVFDDQTLAALDEEESKHLQLPRVHAILESHINKRHKTNSGWKPGIGASSVPFADSYDDLPEISLRVDGSYGVDNPVQLSFQSVPGHAAQDSRVKPSTYLVDNNPVPQNLTETRASASGLRRPSMILPSSVRVGQQLDMPKIRLPEYLAQCPEAPPRLYDPVLELQKRLEEMRHENLKIQSALKIAVDAKLAKEGEVSILRKNIEKTAQNHAAQLSQLKVEREKVELKQTQMQRQLKDEMERLRTQYLFKQQELDSAIRRPTGSVRARKINRDLFPSTPLVKSDGMTACDLHSSQTQGFRIIEDETPVRAFRYQDVQHSSPSSKHVKKSPEKIRKTAMLPGFENAFDTSTPLRPSLRRDKGKGRAIHDLGFGGTVPEISYMQSQPISVPSEIQPQFMQKQKMLSGPPPVLISDDSAPLGPHHLNNEDVASTEAVQDAVADEFEDFEPLNRKAELCWVLLTHSYSSSAAVSLQTLLSSAHLLDSTSTTEYATVCGQILAVLANFSDDEAVEQSMQLICMALLSLLVILHESQQLRLMTVLLDLLTKLSSHFSCQSILLSSRPPFKEGQVISLIDLLCHFILEYLDPAKPVATSHEFAAQIFFLLESLCFQVPQESVDELAALARQKKALMLLLHASQPSWFLERSSILLALLSTHHELSAALLDCSELKDVRSNREYDSRKNLFIERICWLLIDSKRNPTEKYKIYILIFFSQLSIARPDTYAELVHTYTLVPSVILYTSQLAAPLWEDDESLLKSTELAASFVQTLSQTTFLLHQLIFEADPCMDVRLKLHQAPHRPFNGIDHMFVVTFGRLSYCDPPSWLESNNKRALMRLVDIAREILEVVIDGPETDSIWAAFQADPDDENAIDEGEIEARLLGVKE